MWTKKAQYPVTSLAVMVFRSRLTCFIDGLPRVFFTSATLFCRGANLPWHLFAPSPNHFGQFWRFGPRQQALRVAKPLRSWKAQLDESTSVFTLKSASIFGVAQTVCLVNRVFVPCQKVAVLTKTAKTTNLSNWKQGLRCSDPENDENDENGGVSLRQRHGLKKAGFCGLPWFL